ncbi:MAG TPA: class I SAM-dependent methyltransferase [Thermoanaerobaculia bacterium]|nr:class I SAM-dependent methyltransferase [Thermoanaerobaculia bacterium]
MTKPYDRAYFDRWYRGRWRIQSHDEVRRKVMLAVATAEYFLRRPIATVLDVGAGEGAWYPHLRVVRRRASYLGIEPSPYAVERFGKERNIRRGTFADLARLRLRNPFDLVVCSDVLHYLSGEEIRRGIGELARLTRGIAFIEVLTAEDEIVGDLEGLVQRPASWYQRRIEKAGLVFAGPYCWLSSMLREEAGGLEVCREK